MFRIVRVNFTVTKNYRLSMLLAIFDAQTLNSSTSLPDIDWTAPPPSTY
jgi:hypothetical protein